MKVTNTIVPQENYFQLNILFLLTIFTIGVKIKQSIIIFPKNVKKKSISFAFLSSFKVSDMNTLVDS